MTFFSILFWILFILSAIGAFVPVAAFPKMNSVSGLILIGLLGWRVYPLVLN